MPSRIKRLAVELVGLSSSSAVEERLLEYLHERDQAFVPYGTQGAAQDFDQEDVPWVEPVLE